jgi:very-short-patch-repair endonuclease
MGQRILSNHEEQPEPFVRQLEAFRDRLLKVDWRNRSILFRKVYQKWSLDLADFPRAAARAIEKGLRSSGEVTLLLDSELGEDADAKRSEIVSMFRTQRLIEEETGLHDFFVGFPFLQGHLTTEHYVRGPLVLFPARLERRKGTHSDGWHLIFHEDDPLVFNQALLAAVRKVGGLNTDPKLDERLEELAEALTDPKQDLIPSFLTGLEELLKDTGFPLIPSNITTQIQPTAPLSEERTPGNSFELLHLTSNMVLGSFPQASSAIFHDYEELINRAVGGEHDQGIIRNLLEAPIDTLSQSSLSSPTQEVQLDSVPDSKLNFVMQSDASQDAILLEAQRVPCVVVRGPPGTGKSQVIVNLISNALWKGEKVLLVCQKRAALDVVFQRLDKVGLSEYAVLLHDERADRPDAYRRLHQFLSKGLNPPDFGGKATRVELLSRDLDLTIKALNKIAKPLWTEYNGIRLHDLYLRLDPKFMPRMTLDGLENRVDYPALTKLMEKLPDIERGCKRFDVPTHPYQARTSFANLGQTDRIALLSSLKETLQRSQAEYFTDVTNLDIIEKNLLEYLKWRRKTLRAFSSAWRRHGLPGGRFLLARSGRENEDLAKFWLSRIANSRKLLNTIAKLRPFFSGPGFEKLVASESDPNKLAGQLNLLISKWGEFDEIQAHDTRIAALNPVERRLVDYCLHQIGEGESWEYRLPQEIFFRWVDSIERSNPALKGTPFEDYLRLRDKLDGMLEKKRDALSVALSAKLDYHGRTPVLPPGNHHWNRDPATDWNKLSYEFGKKRRLKPLRKLFEDYYFELNIIAGCWMMSPETVSEVFPLKRGMFDLIVFDEASQLAVERSLPTLYRAKRVVIAGDEKQLRPLDIFQIKENEDDEETPESLSTESLLMLAKRIFGFRYLLWHYRSKYQELIDFSNHAFYEGQLQVAGSILRDPAQPPIQWISVRGSWNERRQNPVEASKVVDLIKEILLKGERDGPIPSIGVVTFNDPQRQAILDEIDLRANRDPEFERLDELADKPKSGNIDDRLFVKNIENVQGDERDIIIFSIGYGKDSEGRLRMIFGSLSVEGGENRLNVAITRAKSQVFIVCSFDPEELKADLALNLGPKLLKNYLRYSEAVSDNSKETIQSILSDLNPEFTRKTRAGPVILESELEHQVYERLTKEGFQVDTQIGNSGYRIDLAVAHPRDPSRYILAIECDGSTFHSARSARERDVFRQKFLESRGWVVERVWSRNWWRNPDAEIARLRSRIDTLSSVN